MRAEEAERVVVGLPPRSAASRRASGRDRAAAEALEAILDVPVERFDERFTTTLAGPGGDEDARAAAHLLTSYLEWSRNRQP